MKDEDESGNALSTGVKRPMGEKGCAEQWKWSVGSPGEGRRDGENGSPGRTIPTLQHCFLK